MTGRAACGCPILRSMVTVHLDECPRQKRTNYTCSVCTVRMEVRPPMDDREPALQPLDIAYSEYKRGRDFADAFDLESAGRRYSAREFWNWLDLDILSSPRRDYVHEIMMIIGALAAHEKDAA